jgi:hypothetical protein
MNSKINSLNIPNYSIMTKKSSDGNVVIESSPIDNKDLIQNQEHNSLFKVVQEEKDSSFQNFLHLNNDKIANKNQSKNINIIKPKFVTRTMHNNNLKIKNPEDIKGLNLNLSLNLSSSAFQPQIINKDKEYKVKINNKLYNFTLDIINDKLKMKLNEINDNIYLLKYYYESSFTITDLKSIHRFFLLFDNVNDILKEIEKLLSKNKYNVMEDPENNSIKIQIKVVLLEKEDFIEIPLIQKTYSKDYLFEILCKKVSAISFDFNQRLIKLEAENNFLLMNLYNFRQSINPMNMNYHLNQRENNINKVNNNNNSFIKTSLNNNKYNSNNKENINNYEYDKYLNDESNEMSNSYIVDEDKDLSDYKRLNKKRKRVETTSNQNSNTNNKNNIIPVNIIKNNDILINNNVNYDSSNNNNYYYLRDIKSTKSIKCKGLFDIIHTADELFMIINKILYKLYKYKRQYNISNYENKLQFTLINLFDSLTDGDSAIEFHTKCDYKYNTISLIETSSGHRFGGYTSECFESPHEYFDKKDNLSFVFSFDKMKVYDVIKGKYAISCDKNYGPYFRDDHICIVDEFFTKESGTCIKGKGFNTTKNYELNSGKKYFTIKRLQVFQIKIKNIK